MKIGRRGFLGLLGGAAAAAVVAPAIEHVAHASAPLFIPAERLDMGVPSGRLAAAAMPSLRSTGIFLPRLVLPGDLALAKQYAALYRQSLIPWAEFRTMCDGSPSPEMEMAKVILQNYHSSVEGQREITRRARELMGESLGRRLDDEWSWTKEPAPGVGWDKIPSLYDQVPALPEQQLRIKRDYEAEIKATGDRAQTFQAALNRGWAAEPPYRWVPIVRPEMYG